MPRLSRVFTLLALAVVPAAATPICISGDTLANYEALGAGGCTVGPMLVNGFSFNLISVSGGATAVNASQITVTPDFPSDGFGLIFASSGFSVTGTGAVSYGLGFTWDPTGDIRGAGDILDPGSVDILTGGCEGIAFSGSSCSGTPFSLHVFEGATSQLTDFVSFSGTNIVWIENTIDLNANGGTASFNSIENYIVVPEPGSFAMMLAGLVVVAGVRWRGKGRAS